MAKSIMTLAAVSHLNKVMPDKTRKPVQEKVQAAKKLGVLNWIGMEPDDEYAEIIEDAGPTVRIIKPFAEHERIYQEIKTAERLGAVAVGIDIDHVLGTDGHYDVIDGIPLGPIMAADLAEYVAQTDLPFIAKGVLSIQDALKAQEAGCAGIVVSHHHGRLPFGVPPLAVLPEIWDALKGSGMTDGSLMSGYDAYKVLALGADAVLIGRAILPELLQDDTKGVEKKFAQLTAQLREMMMYTGVSDTSSFDPTVLRRV